MFLSSSPALQSFRRKVILAVCAGVIMMSIPALSFAEEERTAGSKPERSPDDFSETYENLNLFGDVFERVRNQYVEEKEDKELIENALNGMLSALDPHSSYLPPKNYEDMQVETRGQFGGLGIEVTMENGLVKVVAPIDDTPASEAGVESGDLIVEIDGEAVMGLSLSDAVEKMRGLVGTDIDIVVRRAESEILEFTLTRAVIKIQSVRSRAEGNAAYIRITTFNQNTTSGLEKAIKKLNKEIGEENVVGLILDLRNNPGGLLNQAIAVSDTFLDKGEIVSTRGRHERDTKRDNASSGDMLDGKPIAVLVNGGSASASEIVAGALQDHKRGIILGTKTFGKGSVQTVMPLPGHGAMRLTTARYYTPSGRSIQAKGIDPDIVVERAKIEEISVSRVRESDLRGALDNNGQDKKSEKSDEEKKPIDYQLQRGLDLLNGLSLYNSGDIKSVVDAAVAEASEE
jgi:carboxyl-terminal processing protease